MGSTMLDQYQERANCQYSAEIVPLTTSQSAVLGRKRRCLSLTGACLFVLLLPLVGGTAPIFSSQVNHCDPSLGQPEGNPYGYRLRGDRCEGMYVKQVGSTALMIVSFTESIEDYNLKIDKDLVVQWKTPGSEAARLRAYSLRRRLYYRMDTVRPSATESFTWPVSLLSSLEIPRQDLGIIGWIQLLIGTIEREVYVPIRIHQQQDGGLVGTYTVVLLPGVELSEVYVSIARLGENGRPGIFLRDGQALGYGYYPADRRIDFPITNPGPRGFYYLEIGATLKSGGSATVELWFYHPGL